MNNTIFKFEIPSNEKILSYTQRSQSYRKLQTELKKLSAVVTEIPLIIGGKEIRTGVMGEVVMPHNHSHVLARYHKAGEKEVRMAIDAAMEAKEQWAQLSWVERTSVTTKVAELISVKYRHLLNAATMLGQGKNVYQAEIDALAKPSTF